MRWTALVLSIVAPGLASGSEPQWPGDLTSLSIEELANIKITSVARKAQKLSQSAAAVYVITAEDIRRSGATSIPEVLRMAPGLQVAQIDSNKWVVTARGFASRFANKMLVLIDGRSIYSSMDSGVYWEQTDMLLEDIDRIEVIRGPGAAMWGANAVNGVINIITKPAQDTRGILATAAGGNEEQGSGAVRYGAKLGDKLFFRAYAKYFNRAPLRSAGGLAEPGRWDAARGGGRLDWNLSDRDTLLVEGDAYGGSAGQSIYPNFPSVPFDPAIPDSLALSGGNALARWTRRLSARADVALQTYVSQEERSDGLLRWKARTVDFDFQNRWAPSSRHELMWGLGWRVVSDRGDSRLSAPSSMVLEPRGRTYNIPSAFVQDEIAVVPERLALTLGTRVQHNIYTGIEVQPSVRLLWALAPRQSAWGAVSRAVRTPVRMDNDQYVEFQAGPNFLGTLSGGIESETALAYEAGYRNQPARWVTLDFAAFWCNYSALSTVETGIPYLETQPQPYMVLPIQKGNQGTGHTYGAELATNWSITKEWRLAANYSWFRFVLDPPRPGAQSTPSVPTGTSPAHQVQLRSQLDITGRLELDAGLYYVSALISQGFVKIPGGPAGGVPSSVRSDARLGWRLNESTAISVAAQNLFNGRHLEFVPGDYVSGGQPGRAAYVKVTWTF